MRHKRSASAILAVLMVAAILFVAAPANAQSPDDGVYTVGAFLLNILHVPLKLATCVGSQALFGVGYVATYGVEGNYEGGTNGRELGNWASGSCKGQWIIGTDDVKRDYE